MRMLLNVTIPHEPFNTLVRGGEMAETMRKILEAVKPEVVFFTEHGGSRGAVLVVEVKEPSSVPALAEPWFLALNATCEFRIAMTPEDLAKSGIEQVAKKW